ncbi:phage tail protein [Schinkia azotoformans]|uniref:phage tail protein n=1 Tax=Schinkia azotoformans TaxID=1454 RepID=UPI002DB558D9|nr:phage tail protein [Schinkia azotoformans]MEC1744123.1 phage tail protein [Schinkia azotoformans]
MITIDVNNRLLEKAEEDLKYIPKAVPKAVSAALNRTAEMAKTEITRKVRDQYYIRAKDVNETLKIRKASVSNLQSIVRSTGRRRELIMFRVSPNTPRHKNPPSILRVAVKKDGYKGIDGAFVARGASSGELHALRRTDKSRYPIHIKYGPSVPQMIDDEEVVEYINQYANEKFEERIEHEVDRILRGIGG